jgi:ABC-type transport system involved in cytochrome bd biosynthesis fused ATPase/permease subunit
MSKAYGHLDLLLTFFIFTGRLLLLQMLIFLILIILFYTPVREQVNVFLECLCKIKQLKSNNLQTI